MSGLILNRVAPLTARKAPEREPEADPVTDPWGMDDPTVPAPIAALLCAGAVLALAVVQLVAG